MVVKKTNLVWFFYFITFLILLLDTTDNFPLTDKLRLIRYIFMAFMLFMNIVITPKTEGLYFSVFIFVAIITAHTVLFGRVWVNPIVAEYTADHFRQMMIYLFFEFLCARYCFWSDSKREFLIATFFALLAFLFWCYITHLNGFVPIRYLLKLPRLFLDESRYGYSFGMIHRSLTANYASMAILIGALLWEYRFQCQGILWKYYQVITLFSCGLLTVVLISAASRAEMLSVVLYFMIIFGLKFKSRLGSSRARWIINILVILVGLVILAVFAGSVFSEGSLSNRSENFTINNEAFQQYGRKLLGMGYIEQHGFLNKLYGVETFACDVYYLYIYFSTGILGSLILGSALLWLGVRGLSYQHTDARVNIPMKAIILVELFVNFFHCTFASYGYLSSIPIMILLMEYLYSIDYDSKLKHTAGVRT